MLSKTLAQWAKSGHPTTSQLREAARQAARLERIEGFFFSREGIPLFGLKEARKKSKKTQIQLAHDCGLAQPVISALESQRTLATTETARRIAQALGVSIEEIS